jgi:hypothetical protein
MSTFSCGFGFSRRRVVANVVMALRGSGLILLRFAPDSDSVAVPEGRRLVISSCIVVNARRRRAVRRPTAAPLSYRGTGPTGRG